MADPDGESPFRPAAKEPILARASPVSKRLRRYRPEAGRRDLVAGLTVAALALIGPEGALAAPVAAAILPLAAAGSASAASMAATLGLMVAGLFLLARLARLSWVADYLSRPVLIGYIHGVVGVLIIRDGVSLVTARMRTHVEERLVDAAGDEFPPDRRYPTVRVAVDARSGAGGAQPG